MAFWSPTARRTPISRVRSRTDTSMMLAIPMPPTTSEMLAIATRTIERCSMIPFTVDSMSSCEMIVEVDLIVVATAQQIGDFVDGGIDADFVAGADQDVRKPIEREQVQAGGLGDKTMSSRSKPSVWPLCSMMPMTRNSPSATLITLLSAFSSPNSSCRTVRPSTTKRRRDSMSSSVKSGLGDVHLANFDETTADTENQRVRRRFQITHGPAAGHDARNTIGGGGATGQHVFVFARDFVYGAKRRTAKALGSRRPG